MKKWHFILLLALFLVSVTIAFYFFDYADFQVLIFVPYYATSSFLRMGIAYFFALCFALAYGYIAATNKNVRNFMLPFLDILQSVPILGFFPAAVLFFVNLINGRPGVEIAAVFLIFTSMAWNMAFGVYESLTAIPKELVDAADSFCLRGWQRLENLTLPACVPKLVYNSIVSWSAGWFFLVASEIISAGSGSYRLPGLGSFLIDTAYSGKIALMLVDLSALVTIIISLELFIWRPMQSWADKYNYEYAGEKKPGEFIFNTRFIKHSFRFIFNIFSKIMVRLYLLFHRHKYFKTFSKLIGYALLVFAAGYIVYIFAISIAKMFLDLPPDASLIPLALVYSFLRLSVAYLICLLWTVP
ncbi:MAG TPA: ABC transporter permease subunit, partial [Candidatus Methanoperedens sp.]